MIFSSGQSFFMNIFWGGCQDSGYFHPTFQVLGGFTVSQTFNVKNGIFGEALLKRQPYR